jgi:very-short-patch-repair endonuclease
LPGGEELAPIERHRPFIPCAPHLTALARANRKNPTPAEARLWNQALRQRQCSQHKFLRQKPLNRFIVHFYCSALRLVIKVDGDSHAGLAEVDAERGRILASLGLTVLRYGNRDILANIDGVDADRLRWPQDNPGPT